MVRNCTFMNSVSVGSDCLRLCCTEKVSFGQVPLKGQEHEMDLGHIRSVKDCKLDINIYFILVESHGLHSLRFHSD